MHTFHHGVLILFKFNSVAIVITFKAFIVGISVRHALDFLRANFSHRFLLFLLCLFLHNFRNHIVVSWLEFVIPHRRWQIFIRHTYLNVRRGDALLIWNGVERLGDESAVVLFFNLIYILFGGAVDHTWLTALFVFLP